MNVLCPPLPLTPRPQSVWELQHSWELTGSGAGRSRGDLVALRELGDLDSGITTTS